MFTLKTKFMEVAINYLTLSDIFIFEVLTCTFTIWEKKKKNSNWCEIWDL